MNYKIIASLTTIPSRINLISEVISRITNQTIPIHSLEINIPYFFKRKNEEYIIPDWLTDLAEKSKDTKCPILIFRTEDFGPATKVAPTFLRHKNDADSENTYVWSVDDDIHFSLNMLAILFSRLQPYPHRKNILSHSGGNWKINAGSQECEGIICGRQEGLVNFAEGFASVLYPVSVVEDDFEEYILKVIENPFCMNGDDITISNYFQMKGVVIYNCSFPRQSLSLNAKVSYGLTEDALHLQAVGNSERYINIYNWLSENNINGWLPKKLN